MNVHRSWNRDRISGRVIPSYLLSRHQLVCMWLYLSFYGCSLGAVSTKGDGKATCRRRAPQTRGLTQMPMTWQKDTAKCQGLCPLEVVFPKRCGRINAPGRGETTTGGRTSQRGGPGAAMKYNVHLWKTCFANSVDVQRKDRVRAKENRRKCGKRVCRGFFTCGKERRAKEELGKKTSGLM